MLAANVPRHPCPGRIGLSNQTFRVQVRFWLVLIGPRRILMPDEGAISDVQYGNLRTSEAGAGRPFRRPVLCRRKNDRHILPPDLPCSCTQKRKRFVLPQRCRCQRSGIPAMPEMPARVCTGHARMGRYVDHSATWLETDRRRCA